MQLTCTKLSLFLKQKVPRSCQHHDQFEVVEAAAQLQQAQDGDGIPSIQTKTAQSATPTAMERWRQQTLPSQKTMPML